MNPLSMQEVNQAATGQPGHWTLGAGDVRHVSALPVSRWLAVQHGRLWVTREQPAAGDEPEDIWLEAGQDLYLPAGSAWLVEAWPHADARLIEEPPRRGVTPFGAGRWWRSLRSWSPLRGAVLV